MKTSLLLRQKLKKLPSTEAHSERDLSPVGAWGAELKSSGIFCIRGATRRPWFEKRSAHLHRERTDYAEGRGGIKIKQHPRE